MIVSILGAGGHARSVVALLRNQKISIEGIYDPEFKLDRNENILNIKVCGGFSEIPPSSTLVLAIGDNARRKELTEQFHSKLLNKNVIHESALFEDFVNLGINNQIFAKTFFNSASEIGNNNIINTGSIIEHEVVIGSHCHISVGAVLCGRVRIGSQCFIGANTVIRDNITVGDQVTIGAGSVVVNDVYEAGVYAGNPIRKIR